MNYNQQLACASIVYVVSFMGGFRTFLTREEALEVAREYKNRGRKAYVSEQKRS
jgi:hypothetical protein